jgi:hypothetical protein
LNKSKIGVPLKTAIRIPKTAMTIPTTKSHLCQNEKFDMALSPSGLGKTIYLFLLPCAREDENGPATAAFIIGLVCGPNGDQAMPQALDLGIGRFTRLIPPGFSANFKTRDGIGAEIEDPGVGALESRIDIADDDGLAIAQIKDRRRTFPTRAASLGRKEQHVPTRSDGRENPSPRTVINPSLERGRQVLDGPYAGPGDCKAIDHFVN